MSSEQRAIMSPGQHAIVSSGHYAALNSETRASENAEERAAASARRNTAFCGLRDEWLPVVESRGVKRRPVPVPLLGEPFIVVRNDAGIARMVPARGWSRLAGQNSCIRDSTLAVDERDGLIWCCAGRPSQPIPQWPHAEWPGIVGSGDIACNWVRIVENMMDASHAAFVHGGLLRARPSKLVAYSVRESAIGVSKINRGENARGSVLYWLFGNGESEFSHVEEFIVPNWVCTEYRTMRGQVVMAAQFALTPMTSAHTRLFYRVSSPTGFCKAKLLDRGARFILSHLVRRVIAQDRWILEAEERAVQPVGAQPRRVTTVADVAATWAGRRAAEYALGGRNSGARPDRGVEFELRL